MPAFQEYAKNLIVKELKNKMGTEFGIGKLHFKPVNTLELDSVYLYGQNNEKILMADRISAGVDLFSLLEGRIVITSAWLTDFEVHLSKQDSVAPLNIQYIIDAFKPQDDSKPKNKIDFVVNSVNVTNGHFTYDVHGKPFKDSLSFDANHIQVSDLHAKLALKSLASDSLNIQVKKISLKEKSGVEISDLVFRLITQGKKASVRGFNLYLPSSHLQFDRCELDLTPNSDTAKILDYATLDCIIAPSRIAPKDVAAFTPALQHFKDEITLQAHISGSIDNLNVQDLILDYGKELHLVSNTEIKDLRDKDKMYILGSIDELILSSNEIESIVNNFSQNRTRLPQELKRLGTISFEGDVSGYLKQLTAFGSLETALGIVNTDVLFGFNPKPGVSSFVKGKVSTNNFELGKLLENKDLDKASLNLTVDLEKPKYGKIRGSAEGDIHSFDFKGYTYEDIALNASYDGMKVDGQVDINDPNGVLSVNGLMDLTDKENPILDLKARVKNVQLDDLHIAEKMAHSYLSFVVDANFTGNNIDNAKGYIKVDSIDFIREDKLFLMNQLLVEVSGEEEARNLKITSDLIKGEISGSYSFSSLINSVQQTLYEYLPALIQRNDKKKPEDKANIMDFQFQVNNTESLSNVLNFPVTILSPAKIVGFYNSVQDKFKVEAFVPSIKAAGTTIQSGYVMLNNPDNVIDASINALVLGKKDVTNDITLKAQVKDNLVNTNIALLNNGKQKAKGEFAISTLFTREDKDPLRMDIDVFPSELLLNNASWKMEKSHIQIQEGLYAVNNFRVYNDDGSQEININGKYSQKNTNDILKAELKNINLEYVFQTLAIDALQFGGAATGNIFFSTVENKPYANTRLQVSDFKFNGTDLGNLNLFSELDEETNKVVLDGLILSKENKRTKVDGELDPIKQRLSINFDADSVDIGFLNKYAEAVFQGIKGRGTGNVHLYGDFSNVTVEGKAFIENGELGINFLNTRYSFTDTVYMKKDLIYFNDITLLDQNKNKALASGKVSHDFFQNFMYLVDLRASNFLLYNATPVQNPLFYGKVFASGNGSISGDEKVVDIDIRMRTEENTVVRMNFMEEYVNEYSFLKFKSKEPTDSISTASNQSAPIQTSSDMEINMNFYVDATPDAVVELVMDPIGGDVLRGSGSGAMQFSWSTKSSPRLYGTYNINRGSYNFTFQRIMERRFTIQDGSSVRFDGDPFQAVLGVKAIYKITANLTDLSRYMVESTGLTTIPVNCVLNLSGPLRHPNVGLDIDFPSSDAEVERQLKSIINTEDMINKQVAMLLIMSKFYTPDDNKENKTSDFAAVASATLSNQLTKIVNQIDDRWELGTNIRYSDSEMTSTEAELILSSRLLNDRLLINGNFGYRNDVNLDQEAMITDVDIEYLLNNSGTWRIKAYNHYNEKYYYTSLRSEKSTQTQGFGIVYKKDFDGIGNLFKNKRLRILPRTDTIKPIVPDSTKRDSSLSHFLKWKK